jgi:hypothetical protein
MVAMYSSSALAIDSEVTRKTLAGLKGVYVAVENLQPNIEKYAFRFNLTKEQLQIDVEQKLKKAGIVVLNAEQWLKTPGRPMLYVNVNTHEYEKYWYSYTIKLDLQQIVMLETNPRVKTLATTWEIDMTGIANIGTLDRIRANVSLLVDRFIDAHSSVNLKKQ